MVYLPTKQPCISVCISKFSSLTHKFWEKASGGSHAAIYSECEEYLKPKVHMHVSMHENLETEQ